MPRAVSDRRYSPLYNAELAPPEVRGFLVALQQLTTTIGIFLAYWIAYGTSHINGGNSEWAWRIPLLVQGVPAVILAIGVWFLPFSPRLLMNKGREDEALKTLADLRGLPEDHELVQVELLEIKAEVLFEREDFAKKFPNVKTDSIFRREIAQYVTIFRNKESFKRVALGSLVMFFQQWSGIDSSKSNCSSRSSEDVLTCDDPQSSTMLPSSFRTLDLLAPAPVSSLLESLVSSMSPSPSLPSWFSTDSVARLSASQAASACSVVNCLLGSSSR
jgi:MFS family permease